MKTKTITYPKIFANAIVNLDYQGLTKADIRALNKALLKDNVLFCDVIKTSNEREEGNEYIKIPVMDFTFEIK